MRQSAVQRAGQRVKVKLPMWDFALHRDDGTGVRLHPHWGDRKVEALPLVPRADFARPPAAGLGGSEGPGTCRKYKDLGVERRVKFDAAREKGRPTPPQGPRSSGAAAPSTGASASGPRSSGASWTTIPIVEEDRGSYCSSPGDDSTWRVAVEEDRWAKQEREEAPRWHRGSGASGQGGGGSAAAGLE